MSKNRKIAAISLAVATAGVALFVPVFITAALALVCLWLWRGLPSVSREDKPDAP